MHEKETRRENKNGELYVVATPIGNLEDISLRALRVLKEVDAILCEDTRVTGKLLAHFDIKKPLISYHARSSQHKEEEIIRKLREGKRYALVSDAGTPAISDPGSKLIDAIYRSEKAIRIIPIPGPSAVISVLSVSGFFGNQFTFYGFFPQKKGRKKLLKEIFSSSRIAVFYESPHRILKLFEMIKEYFPEHYTAADIFIGRELTKMYEETVRGAISDVHDYFLSHSENIRGEFVIVIYPHL